MKKEIGKPVFFVVIALVVAALAWFGWNAMETPENRGLNEEAIFREAEKKARANGVDIRTLPQWGELYYKYHPEEKRPEAGAQGPPTMDAPGGMPAMPPAPR